MKSIWVVGDGGMGSAIEKALRSKGHAVTVLSRKRGIDLLSTDAIHAVAQSKHNLPDTIINTCGILHDQTHLPEKSLSDFNTDWLTESIAINVGISINLAKVMNEYLSSEHAITFCAFSARVSSISDNQKGGWYSYRMSKAMLNMFIKNLALEWHIKSPNTTVFGYHPGTVDTQLSQPFQKYIHPDTLFSTEQATAYFLKILFDETLNKHGKLIDWQGKEVLP